MTALTTLQQHVYESNAIEGIYARVGNPLFDRHLGAASCVARNPHAYVFDVRSLHRLLLDGVEHHAGEYRRRQVYIGTLGKPDRELVLPEHVPAGMDVWYAFVREIVGQHDKVQTDELAHRVLVMHYMLLCIHPFLDGNGRTARLHMNAMRLACELPWEITRWTKRDAYYRAIRSFEEQVFREQFADMF